MAFMTTNINPLKYETVFAEKYQGWLQRLFSDMFQETVALNLHPGTRAMSENANCTDDPVRGLG